MGYSGEVCPGGPWGDVGWGERGPPYIPFRSHFPGWLACGWVGSGIVPICSMCCALLCCVAGLWLGWSCICSISFHVLYTDFGWVVVGQWVKCWLVVGLLKPNSYILSERGIEPMTSPEAGVPNVGGSVLPLSHQCLVIYKPHTTHTHNTIFYYNF